MFKIVTQKCDKMVKKKMNPIFPAPDKGHNESYSNLATMSELWPVEKEKIMQWKHTCIWCIFFYTTEGDFRDCSPNH